MLVVGVAGREIFDETTMVVVGVVVCKIAMGVGCLIICPTRIWILIDFSLCFFFLFLDLE